MRCFLSLVFFLLFGVLIVQAQIVPNGDFESWENFGSYENPELWNTANDITSSLGVFTTQKTNDSYTGDFSALMEAKTALTFTVPGLITLGDFTIDIWTQESEITGGIPFDLRPDKINLFYKYQPVTGDSFRIGMWLLRDDGTDVPDTVATALYNGFDSFEDYNMLSLKIEYRSEETPEILNIIAISTNPDNPVVGSVLKIDDIHFECSTNIEQRLVSAGVTYPNPTNDLLYINKEFIDMTVEVYNQQGMQVRTINTDSELFVSLAGLKAGIYFVKAYKQGETQLYYQKIIKN
jgi:hypothetical protein